MIVKFIIQAKNCREILIYSNPNSGIVPESKKSPKVLRREKKPKEKYFGKWNS